MSEQEEDDSKKLSDTAVLLKLCVDLHTTYVREHQLSDLAASRLPLATFLTWFREQDSYVVTEEDMPAYAYLMDLSETPEGVAQIARWWYMVTLKYRPGLRYDLSSLHLVALLRWEDGRACPLSCLVPAELSTDAGVFTDRTVCELIQDNGDNLVSMIVDNSLDALHDHRSQQVNQSDFEVVMGLMLKLLDGHAVVDPNTKNDSGEVIGLTIAKDRIDGCRNVMRLLQSLFSPPIPPAVKNHILNVQQRKAAAAKNLDPVTGGWG